MSVRDIKHFILTEMEKIWIVKERVAANLILFQLHHEPPKILWIVIR